MAHPFTEREERRRSLCRNGSANTYYVDPLGNDYNPGTLDRPFKTIQHAIDVATVIYTNYSTKRSKNINIAFGTYAETLSITCPVQLTGSTPTLYAQSSTCSITGDITVNISASISGSMRDTQVGIFNILVSGSITDNSTAKHTLVIKDVCVDAAQRCLHQNQTSPDCRTFLENVAIASSGATGTVSAVEISSGVLEISRCRLTAAGPRSVLELSGTAKAFVITLSTFENTFAGVLVPALVIDAASASTAVTSFSDCVFAYTSADLKPPTSSFNTGIYLSAADIVVVNCFFNLQGTTGSGYAIDEPVSGTGSVAFSNVVAYTGTALIINVASKSQLTMVS